MGLSMTSGKYRADYALLNSNGEAGTLSPVRSPASRLSFDAAPDAEVINYANITGVPYAVLTDGHDQWDDL